MTYVKLFTNRIRAGELSLALSIPDISLTGNYIGKRESRKDVLQPRGDIDTSRDGRSKSVSRGNADSSRSESRGIENFPVQTRAVVRRGNFLH